ncbi:G protein pathway suppressor 1, putative [Brugia malayi]|uniref:BMA-CSN-1, isoform a n=2 Tax=Brugia malayi TaxID=6279 RepID=A0A0K0JQ73_BRUMA|nr:G protein pathway suppressor 1, putative [Brugia malayi]CDP98785.1 BMA-CSN-1, isoform a [Brugia malayi]VIO98666.1 G protein pathway suppressor 1, putative [Brugia malayi]
MSAPDPDEAMDAHVEEPIDDNDFDLNNANEVDDEFVSQPIVSPLLPGENGSALQKMPFVPTVVQNVVNSVPFDLEAIRNNYTGYGLINRLLFIADNCPPLQKDSLIMLINYIVEHTSNVQVYLAAHHRLNALRSASVESHSAGVSADMNIVDDLPRVNSQWMDATTAKSQARLDILAAEFKRQKEEGVKESTRRTMHDLFEQQITMGQLQEAAKLYSRGIREYCTSPKHIIEMLMSWIEVTIYLNQWHRVEPLLTQVERALIEAMEVENVAATSTSRPGRLAANSTYAATRNMKEIIDTAKAKIGAVAALNYLNMRNYRLVAEKCLKIEFDYFDYPALLASKDVVMFGTICALATFSRSELKEKVLGSLIFWKFLEAEPRLIELLQKFVKSQFGICFDILEEIRDQLLLNMHLWSHVRELYYLIRRRAIVQYFTPYAVADMDKMAVTFRVHVNELENELVKLIMKDEISARIDSSCKKLYAKIENQVTTTYNELIEVSNTMHHNILDILLRAALHQAQIIVGQTEHSARNRRRPLQGSPATDEFSERKICAGSASDSAAICSTSQLPGPAKSLMSRIFGSARVTFSPTNSSQAAEADSSDEVPKASPLRRENMEIAPAVEKPLSETSSSIIVANANSQEVIMQRHSGDQPPSFLKDAVSDVDGCDRVDE